MSHGVELARRHPPPTAVAPVAAACTGMMVAAFLASGPAGGPGSLSGGRRAIGPMSRGRRGPGLLPQ
eukprot:9726178-Alexandrium_andersonii.AAC.1